MVHRTNCANIKSLLRNPENYFHLNWSENIAGNFQVQLNVVTQNQPGVLARISNIIAEHNSNINNVNVEQSHREASEMSFIIEVTNRDHLASILRQIRAEPTVVKVWRQ